MAARPRSDVSSAAATQSGGMNKSSSATILALGVLAAFGLTGCTAIAEQLHHEASHTFSSTTDLAGNWNRSVPWLPADATEIRTHESTTGDPAILRADTKTKLDPARCAEIDRQSAPTFDEPWSPKSVYVDKVWVCGDWAVIPTDNGWFGWTPVDPDEKALSPVGCGESAFRRSEPARVRVHLGNRVGLDSRSERGFLDHVPCLGESRQHVHTSTCNGESQRRVSASPKNSFAGARCLSLPRQSGVDRPCPTSTRLSARDGRRAEHPQPVRTTHALSGVRRLDEDSPQPVLRGRSGDPSLHSRLRGVREFHVHFGVGGARVPGVAAERRSRVSSPRQEVLVGVVGGLSQLCSGGRSGDVHEPRDAELVDTHAEGVAPDRRLQGHRHGATLDELLPVAAHCRLV